MNEDIVGDARTQAVVRQGLGSGIDTFTVTFTVEQAGEIETASNHAVKVVVDSDTGTNPGGAVNNLMTDKKITPATSGFGATLVGDGVKFGIDNLRPPSVCSLHSIVLDAEAGWIPSIRRLQILNGLIEAVRIQIGDDHVFRAVSESEYLRKF